MSVNRLILLPGMDGTGHLFSRFSECLPEAFDIDIVDYPADQVLDHSALVDRVEQRIARGTRHIVIAESYSGAVAIQYALRRPDDVAALVLSASFVSNPLPRMIRWLPRLASAALLSMPPPAPLVRYFLCESKTSAEDVRDVTAAVRTVRPAVLAARVRSLTKLNVHDQLRQLTMPVLYLQGTHDRLVGARGAEQVQQALPGAVSLQLDAPHLILQSRPQDAADAIIAFLAANGILSGNAGTTGTPSP